MGKESRHIVVFGATGQSGRALTEQALLRGWRVTGFVRNPRRMGIWHDKLDVIAGDILDPASIRAALTKVPDAAYSALGVFSRQPSTVLSEGTANILHALRERGVERFLAISSLGVGDSRGQGNWAARAWARFMIPRVLEDKERQEQLIRESGLCWTVYRPPQLVKGDRARDLVEWSGEAPDTRLTWKINRASLARRMLDAMDDPSTYGRALNVSDPA